MPPAEFAFREGRRLSTTAAREWHLEAVIDRGQGGRLGPAGIAMSGWMSRGLLIEDGHRPEFAELYGAREYPSPDYPSRRRANLALAAELGGQGWGLAVAFDAAPGGGLSAEIRGLLDYRDGPLLGGPCPRIVVVRLARLVGPGRSGFRSADRGHTPEWLAGQIERCRAEALLVAGNRESTSPGVGDWVERFLIEVFRRLAR
jgi:hypothetical protein